jgi:hypothetical protein
VHLKAWGNMKMEEKIHIKKTFLIKKHT